MELCLEHAKERNLSVDRVADLMGLPSKWVIYKWLENGRMPATLIRPFEHACGVTCVTDYLGGSAHKLLIDIPTGKQARQMDAAELQKSFSYAITRLIEFYEGAADADVTLTALTSTLKGIAWHRENIQKQATPELGLFEETQG
jgi:hypothetical protein